MTRPRWIVSTLAFLGLLIQPSVALSQEPTPTPTIVTEEQPLITGDTLFFLLLAVAGLAILLLGLIVWRIGRSPAPTGGNDLYKPLIEGMVLVMVVVAVIILGVAGKLTQEGLASILAAIVGYAVGRAAGTATGSAPPAGGAGAGGPAAGGAASGGPAAGEPPRNAPPSRRRSE
jgi:uncharacterized membrane protein YgcG